MPAGAAAEDDNDNDGTTGAACCPRLALGTVELTPRCPSQRRPGSGSGLGPSGKRARPSPTTHPTTTGMAATQEKKKKEEQKKKQKKNGGPPSSSTSLFVDAPLPSTAAHHHDDDDDDGGDNRRVQVLRRMGRLTGTAAIGGFLFGYDTGVISGAMPPLKRAFDLTGPQQEAVVSSAVLAAFVSSLLLGAAMNDRYGRRGAILCSAALFGVGSAVLACAHSYPTLVAGRVIVGVGIGVASLTTPIYIAEVAPPSMRGRLVTLNALMVTIGQFSAGMVDGAFDYWMPENGGWRYMLGLGAVPSLIMFVGFLSLPESPRWLAERGRLYEAEAVLVGLRETPRDAQTEMEEIIAALPATSTNRRRKRRPGVPAGGDDDDEYYGAVPVDETTSLASVSTPGSSSYGSDASLELRDHPDDCDRADQWDLSSLPPHARGRTGPASDGGHNGGASVLATKRRNSALAQLHAMLSHAPTRRALILGCGLMAVQQFSGVSVALRGPFFSFVGLFFCLFCPFVCLFVCLFPSLRRRCAVLEHR